MSQVTLDEIREKVQNDEELEVEDVTSLISEYFDSLEDMDEQVEFLNALRDEVHDISPFEEPVDRIKWVKQSNVEGNDYNPNEVATPEMDLLHTSIKEDGYTQPIVTYELEDGFEVVDGFHRMLIGKNRSDIRERLCDYVPVTVIDKSKDKRMGSTIRHNRARGTHQIEDMSSIVVSLTEQGWSEEEICEELGMDMDEVIKLKQSSGLKQAFSGHEFSQSWTEYKEDDKEDDEEE